VAVRDAPRGVEVTRARACKVEGACRSCSMESVSFPQGGLHEELKAVGLVTLGLEDSVKTIAPHEFSLDLLDKEVKALVVGSDRWVGQAGGGGRGPRK
jgi:hypothetical protein